MNAHSIQDDIFEELMDRPNLSARLIIYLIMIILGFVLYAFFRNETEKYTAMYKLYLVKTFNTSQFTEPELFHYGQNLEYILNNPNHIKDTIDTPVTLGSNYSKLENLIKQLYSPSALSKSGSLVFNKAKADEITTFLNSMLTRIPVPELLEDRIKENQQNQLVWILGAIGLFLFTTAFYFFYNSLY